MKSSPYHYQASIDIHATPETIWSIMSDVVRWAEWLPTVTSVEALTAPEMALAAKYKILQPKLQPAVWTVTALSPKQNFTWQTGMLGLKTLASHTIQHHHAQHCTVSLSITFSGFLAAVVAKQYGELTASYLQQEAEALKAKSEHKP